MNISDKGAVTEVAEKLAASVETAKGKVEEVVKQLGEAVPQVMMALKIKPAALEHEGEVHGVSGAEVKVKTKAVVIEDVHRWKAGLKVSEGPVGLIDVREFEEQVDGVDGVDENVEGLRGKL